jgi:endonuclease/exonuclease/phosphatase family metal-dependent hydrolase
LCPMQIINDNNTLLTVATANLLNLALPNRSYYENRDPYKPVQYEEKCNWLGAQFARLDADVLAVQEVWDADALKYAVKQSGLHYSSVLVPGAEDGAQGTPRVGLVTRLPVKQVHSIDLFDERDIVQVPELGPHTRFERPVLHVQLALKPDVTLHILVVHLKSKRPKFLQDDAGDPLENRDDPHVAARGILRSLVMRASEAAALRSVVVRLLNDTQEPLIMMGDLNDVPQAVTSQMVAATQAIAFDRSARDTALFNAYEVQSQGGLLRDVAYSFVHQGRPETLDQIWVSEELVSSSKFSRGEVRRVDYFNDHLHEGRDDTLSDHGFVRAMLRWRG